MSRLVRATGTGEIIVCAWSDCSRAGYEENKVVSRDGETNLHYVFCSELHRDYWLNSHISYGNVGQTAKRSPLGLILP